jgi:hypothetical protein
MRIAGKTYIPCVCYPVTRMLELTVNKLEAEGKAVTYTERVFFQNGRVIEKKPVVKETLTTGKKEKKTKKTKAEEPAKEPEEVNELPEGTGTESDEAEGF